MDTELDYKAIAEQLQRELEDARIALLGVRQARSRTVSTASIKQFLTDNYVLIATVSTLLIVLLWIVSTVRDLFSKE